VIQGALEEKTRSLCVYGWVTYDDVFRISHQTQFCYDLTVLGKTSERGDIAFNEAFCPTHNCADEECDKEK
jgi:hypothetical protein